MMERNIYDHYGLVVKETFIAGRYSGFFTENSAYLLIPDSGPGDEWTEKLEWARYVEREVPESVAIFIPPHFEKFSAPIDGEKQLLFRLPNSHRIREEEVQNDGSLLGRFHHRTSPFFQAATSNSFADRWSLWWEVRLQQLENWYAKVRDKTTYSLLDRWFLQTFPYYIGRVENAIQWVKYTAGRSLDQERGCITHFCFTPGTWITMDEDSSPIILPSDWLYDHPSRDVAEWTRNMIEENESEEMIVDFLKSYQEKHELTPYGWQLLFGRLMFPYTYMEQMEQMYLRETTEVSEEIEQQLYQVWERENTYLEKTAFILESFVPDWQKGPEWLFPYSSI